MTSVSAPLLIVPASPRDETDLDRALRCLVSIRASAPAVDVVVVAHDPGEADLLGLLAIAADELETGFAEAGATGSSSAINVGLERARAEHRDAVIVDPAVELIQSGWLERMLARTDTTGSPAAVVGARLIDARGLVHHAGYYFSLYSREWCVRHLNGPAQLPAALLPAACPVSAGLQLIRGSCLDKVGLYDADYGSAWADIDYCLRVFGAGFECVYEPLVIARWNGAAADVHPSGTSGQHGNEPLDRLRARHLNTDFSPWVPAIL